MKPALAILLYLWFFSNLNGQSIHGSVVDSQTGEPLEYVSIGVLNTRYGTRTLLMAAGLVRRLSPDLEVHKIF